MPSNSDIRRSMLEELLEGQPTTKKRKTTQAAPIGTIMLDAQRAFDEKRYNTAIRLFSHALENLRDRKADLIHIYDLRGTSYVKIAQHDLALKDAKEMIKVDRSDARGYLKCAHIEQLRGRLPEATRICEYGLKKIPASDKGYKRLETCLVRIKEQARSKVVYEKGTDPFSVLPPELLDIVLDCFDYKDTVAVMRVSKKWRDVLRSTDTISRNVDFRRSLKTLTYEQVRVAFTRVGKTPKLMALAHMNENACRYATQELSHWIRWESLESFIVEEGKMQLSRLRFEKFKRLRVFHIGPAASLNQDLPKILETCPNLEVGSFQGNLSQGLSDAFTNRSLPMNHKLRTLIICGRSNNLCLPTECLFPSLERLDLQHARFSDDLDLRNYASLRDLALRKVHVEDNLRTAAGLTTFELDGPYPDIYPQPEEIKMPAADLERIILKGPDSIRFLGHSFRQGLSSTKLQYLSISDFVTFSQVAGRSISSDLALLSGMQGIEAFSGVGTLVIKDDHIIDTDFMLISAMFPALQSIDIEAERITDAFVSDLVRQPCCKINTITLRNCPNVPSNIVKWGQMRNVEITIVKYGAKGDVMSGRLVRYE
ncbi:hypothetical protein H2198_000011 [Neophaeococcomyces mojaviensis]|uniref:Uncharacterized protein n=1 Tax=Neophaeococcomyces mojaviensis TaxID=3383035 RepID=A0ACC3AKQ1_9EURO|nr:hypothetical protein H2198_000011 [Knufia sp. JES_112]